MEAVHSLKTRASRKGPQLIAREASNVAVIVTIVSFYFG